MLLGNRSVFLGHKLIHLGLEEHVGVDAHPLEHPVDLEADHPVKSRPRRKRAQQDVRREPGPPGAISSRQTLLKWPQSQVCRYHHKVNES